MPTHTLDTDLPLRVDVPQLTLMDGEKIVRHPDEGSEVAWTITSQRRTPDGALTVDYRTPDGTQDSRRFSDPDGWVRVEVGQVYR